MLVPSSSAHPPDDTVSVPDWILNATDVFADKFDSLKEALGDDRTLTEQWQYVDHHYLVGKNRQVALLTAHGRWAVKRDAQNDRGDMSTKMKRKESVESIGICHELRAEAFLIEHEDMNRHDEFYAAHWASLIEGAELAFNTTKGLAPHLQNKTVLHSVHAGLKDVRIYSRKTPDFIRRWLKDVGNLLNSEVTATTPQEVWRSTSSVENGFSASCLAVPALR